MVEESHPHAEELASTPSDPTPPATAWGRLKLGFNRHLNPGDGDPRAVDSFIIILIALNVFAVMMQTDRATAENYATFFAIFEAFSSIFFTIEYVLRLWVCTLNPRFAHPILGRIKYIFTPMALIDLIAVAPFYFELFGAVGTGAGGGDSRIARAIRMFRLLRILKMGRYANAVRMLSAVFMRKKEELAIVTFVLVMLLILCSSAIYFVEYEAQPGEFPSIPASMWWSIVTITSVGYGDISPITDEGKVVGGIICLIGVLFVALPTGILSAGFLETMREKRMDAHETMFGYCPHCGEQLNPMVELE